jgi:hypothetical protein
MRDKVIALSQKKDGKKQSSDEDKPMTKKKEQTPEKKARAPKKSLTLEDIARMGFGYQLGGMILEWDAKPPAR